MSENPTRRDFAKTAIAATAVAGVLASGRAFGQSPCDDYPSTLNIPIQCKNMLRLIGGRTIQELFDPGVSLHSLLVPGSASDLANDVRYMQQCLRTDARYNVAWFYTHHTDAWNEAKAQNQSPPHLVFQAAAHKITLPFYWLTTSQRINAAAVIADSNFLNQLGAHTFQELFCTGIDDLTRDNPAKREILTRAKRDHVFTLPPGTLAKMVDRPSDNKKCNGTGTACVAGEPEDYCEIINNQCSGMST